MKADSRTTNTAKKHDDLNQHKEHPTHPRTPEDRKQDDRRPEDRKSEDPRHKPQLELTNKKDEPRSDARSQGSDSRSQGQERKDTELERKQNQLHKEEGVPPVKKKS